MRTHPAGPRRRRLSTGASSPPGPACEAEVERRSTKATPVEGHQRSTRRKSPVVTAEVWNHDLMLRWRAGPSAAKSVDDDSDDQTEAGPQARPGDAGFDHRRRHSRSV